MTKEEQQELTERVNEINKIGLTAILREHPEREREIIAGALRQIAVHEIQDHECSTSAAILNTLAEYLQPVYGSQLDGGTSASAGQGSSALGPLSKKQTIN